MGEYYTLFMYDTIHNRSVEKNAYEIFEKKIKSLYAETD